MHKYAASANRACLDVLQRYGFLPGHEKQALTPRSLAGLGAGLGMGIGAVQGFYHDDPTKSVDSHFAAALRSALVGGAIGGAAGGLTGFGLGRVAPELVEVVRRGPYPEVSGQFESSLHKLLDANTAEARGQHRGALARAGIQNLYEAWQHPASRLVSGALLGHGLAESVQKFYDEHNFVQHAAQKAQYEAPEQPNAAWLAAAQARRHMGQYSSSLDRARPVPVPEQTG